MCGIGGYNASEEFVEKYITHELQFELLEKAWMCNLHRGVDAAGYFAVYPDDNALKVMKKGKAADEVLSTMKSGKLRPSRVFAAHTRAATQGTKDKAWNNHPVYYDGVWVTHNGTIRNDDKIRAALTEQEQKKLPEVDSVAIAIVLAQYDDPYNIIDIGDDLYEYLTGGYAFHAVWKDHPGVSLLARGASNPLIVAWNPDFEIVLYASEVDAIWHMINLLDITAPNNFKWRIRKLDTFHAMLVKDGIPFNWVKFNGSWGNTTMSDQIVSRILPDEDGREFQIVYSSDKKHDFAQKDKGTHRDISAVADEHIYEVYTREKGFGDGKLVMPFKTDSSVVARVSEADRIIKRQGTDMYHCFFGDVEVIMNKHHTIQDVYNHAVFKTEDRWYVEDKEKLKKEEEALETFEDWFTKSTTFVQIPQTAPPYQIIERRKQKALPLATESPTNKDGKTGRRQPSGVDGEDTSNGKYLKPNPVLTWENVFTHTYDHFDDALGFFFLDDKAKCSAHDVRYVDHFDPQTCKYAQAMASYAYSCLSRVDLIPAKCEGAYVEYTSYELTCGDELAKHNECEFFIVVEGRVRMRTSGNYYDIPLVEECVNCNAQKEAKKLPVWLELIMNRKAVHEVAS